MSRYNGNNNGDDTSKLNSVETRKHPVTGLEHPSDKVRYFFSRFSLKFLVCYSCGQMGHRNTQYYPMARGYNLTNIHSSENYCRISFTLNVRI